MIKLNKSLFYKLFLNKSDDKVKDDVKLNLKHDQVNNLLASDVRNESFDGDDYAVFPVIMIKHTVVNGSLVEVDDLIAESWNGVPVTVNHPSIDGNDVSANHPEVLSKFEVGRIFNARLDGDKLKAEVWVNVDKANQKFPDLLTQMKTKDMDVSTGYFALDIPKEGTFNNKDYTNQHKDIKPDHLALLPDTAGACSFEDGCGIRANEEKTIKSIFENVFDKFKSNKSEDETIISALKALQSDLEVFLTKEKENMTNEVKTNCEGLTAEEKQDLDFLRGQIKAQRSELVTQAAKKLGVEEDTLKSFSLDQLNVVVNSKAEENQAEEETKNNEQKQADYSGRSNAQKKTENGQDYSDMLPMTANSLIEKKDK